MGYIRGSLMSIVKVCVFLLGIMVGGHNFCVAKSAPDSIELEFGAFTSFSSVATPLWLRSNQQGLVSAQPKNAGVMARLALQNEWGKRHSVSLQFSPVLTSSQSFFNTNTYAEYGFGVLRATVGAKHLNNDIENDSLATGSFGLSRNAKPVPGLQLGIYEYTEVPFTGKWVSIRGWLKHGLFWDNRFIEKPMLHEKHAGLRIGRSKLQASFNLYHYAAWNGVHPAADKGAYPGRWQDYWRVFRGKSADYSYYRSWRFTNEFNALGNHIGVGNVGLKALAGKHSFEVCYEKMAEDKGGFLEPSNNKDFKLTLNWKHKGKKTHLQALVEFIKTDWQSGPGIPDSNKRTPDNFGYEYGGRDDYYNNGNYRSGWTHHGTILGSPLFLTNDDAKATMNVDINDYNRHIINNRVRAFHMGFSVAFPQKNIGLKARSTFSRNYGTYTGLNGGRYEWGSRDENWSDHSYPFNSVLKQSYHSLEINYQMGRSAFQTLVGIDLGDMYNTAGFLVQYTYRIR